MLKPVSFCSWSTYVNAGLPLFLAPCFGSQSSRSLITSSFFLQQCPINRSLLIISVSVILGRLPYSSLLVSPYEVSNLINSNETSERKKDRCSDFQSVGQNRGHIGDSFPVQPVIAYRRHASLRDLLVHSTLHSNTPHTQQPAGVYKCNHPRCLTCPFLQESRANYIFTATIEQRKIIDYLSCKSKNLIYLI